MGIIEIVLETNANERTHYLPHRAVFKECSTTKIRPVFDASNKDENGSSLNDCLEVGPNVVDLIPIVLIIFRIYAIALSSDIEKAFLQIEINPEDRDFLRFLWWEKGNIVEFRYCRVVFGVYCSPFLLSACLNNLLENPPEHLSKIAKKLKGTFYMDNSLTGVSKEEEIESHINKATLLMSTAGFNLRGWKSSRFE
ncbi:uncharacterized protein LOC118193027 [Stegodyphus dumicola]|uniref:uncharacterized protein LOC118193027 n=1 Tax=Stegodyphus dumicola TaxID=202533 RepID=UPI0015B22318|nr:uncharacterized protein LOC118193027 [Stegodyphus dumicola]